MRNIFLAPRSNETSYKNFESTIIAGRPLEFFRGHLNPEEERILSKVQGSIKVWGNKESLRSRWEKMRAGDYILFYSKGAFYYSARVILTKFSDELGAKLWPTDEDGKPWPCLFFIENLRQVHIPIKIIQELAEYEPTWDRVQGFMNLRESGIRAINEKFGNTEVFLSQPKEVYIALNSIIESSKDEVVEDEKPETVNKEELLKLAKDYKDIGISYILNDAPQKRRVESRLQKKRVAEIEDYLCQICGWSLEWENSRGKKSYRIDVDHIIEKSKGGTEEITNLWTLCPNCHTKKTFGVIKVDLGKKIITENGEIIKLKSDNHLKW